jgi:HAMP domain-containing protein
LSSISKNQKGQSSFEILFVTILVILLAGTLFVVSFSNTKNISEIGIIKSEVETYFVQNNLLLTIKDIELVGKNELTAKIILSTPHEFSTEQIGALESKLKDSVGKEVTLLFN